LELGYGDSQATIAVVFAFITITLVGVFLAVALRSRRELPFERVRAAAYRLRRGWVVLLSLILVGGIVVSLALLPYSGGAQARAEVMVKGGQFYWSISRPTLPAGGTVRFAVTSIDVNHGFGVYGPGGELLGQVQAMPGYTNHLELELDEPGSYLVSCLEFCGVGHHEMIREIEVTAE
jgi:cytochrome c oxidase subunit 2